MIHAQRVEVLYTAPGADVPGYCGTKRGSVERGTQAATPGMGELGRDTRPIARIAVSLPTTTPGALPFVCGSADEELQMQMVEDEAKFLCRPAIVFIAGARDGAKVDTAGSTR